ncbi:Pineal opsin [Liparis tanakae]|uniref:Pineal opsin n=1 Tax=Liparis tanakae TaxID=230148 RepID=A0A4Z2G0P4_9TELE|nr:Pineal opsin [Liparis tanakae]
MNPNCTILIPTVPPLCHHDVRGVRSVVSRHREQRVLVMVVVMVVCYLVCWLPYGVAALLATFGPRDLLTPEATVTPSLLAKFSTVINPFIYIFMNKQVSRCVAPSLCFRAFFHCSTPERGSTTVKTFSRPTKTPRPLRRDRGRHVSAPAPSSAAPTPDSVERCSQGANHASPIPPPSDRHSAAAAAVPKLILAIEEPQEQWRCVLSVVSWVVVHGHILSEE